METETNCPHELTCCTRVNSGFLVFRTNVGRFLTLILLLLLCNCSGGGNNTGINTPAGTSSPPSKPVNITAISGDSQTTISWSPTANTTSYTVYWSNSPNDPPSATKAISGISSTTYTHTGLVNGTTYYYRVSACNGIGESTLSDEVGILPAPNVPSQPQTITVTPGSGQAGGGRAAIAWNGVTGATSYTLYWSTSPQVTPSTSTRISEIPVTGYTHIGLLPDVTYYYRVSASNAKGESSLSSEVSVRLSQMIDVRLFRPDAFARTDTPLNVIATISSTYEIASAVAYIEGASYPLSYDRFAIYSKSGGSPGWVVTVPLTGMTRGAHTLSVTATDVNGDKAIVSTSFVFDSKPLLSVLSPANYDVLRNTSLHVAVTCTDDDPAGCASISVYANDKLLVTMLGNIDKTLTLNALDGTSVPIRIEATDSWGQAAVPVTRTVFIESLPGLSAVASVAGDIKDFSNDRILYVDSPNSLKIHTIANNTDTTVISGAMYPVIQAGLTSSGALYALEGSGSAYGNLYEFKNATSELLGVPTSAFKVAGNFAIWFGTDNYIHLRNLAAGTDISIGNNPGNNGYDVAANGDVVYWEYSGSDINIFRYRNGYSTRITLDTGGVKNTNPKTDGNLIAYVKQQNYSEIYLYDGVREVLLSGAQNGVSPPPDYQVNNSWVAYPRLGSTNQEQIWLRSPTGVVEQVTYFSADSNIVALAPNGEVIVANSGRLYLYKPGQSGLINVASQNAAPKYLNGSWQYVVGRTLFKK